MIGCTSTSDGDRGFVPQPKKGMQDNYYLGADGTWKQVKQRSVKDIIDIIYPVGFVIATTGDQNPNQLWPGTTWKRTLQGRVPIGAGEYWENGKKFSYSVGDTGGEAEHKLTESELPRITPKASCSTTGNHTHQYLNVSNQTGNNQSYNGASSWATWQNTKAAGNHSHSVEISSFGGGAAHENRMPYSGVAYWVRTQ